MKHIVNPNSFAYLYSSPYTRCVQTAIQIAKDFKDAGGKELKISIEYGLAENITYGQVYFSKISDGKITENFSLHIIIKTVMGKLCTILLINI